MKEKIKKNVAKAALVSFTLASVLPAGTAFAASNVTDVNGHWAERAIHDWLDRGYIGGYEDDTFRPDQIITRAEFVKLVNKTINADDAAVIAFSDVQDSDWFAGEVALGVGEGYVSGFEDGTFRPGEAVTRAQAAAFLTKALKLTGDDNEVARMVDNGTIPDWARGSVGAVLAKGYMGGYEDGTFRPNRPLTRAEAVSMLNRVLGDDGNGGSTKPPVINGGGGGGSSSGGGGSTITKYTVTFDYQYDGKVEKETVKRGSTLDKPEDPTREGYTFGGWYKDEDCTEAWNFKEDKVKEATTLYAEWIEIEVDKVVLDSTELSLNIGDTQKLKVTITPADALDQTATWTSSDTSVVTVDKDGNVTAVGEGTATITVKVGDKTATCTVTVAEEAVVEVAPKIEVAAPEKVEVKTAVEADETGRIADFDPTGYESVDVTLTAGDVAYSNVRFVVAEATPGLQLIAQDTNGNWYDMVKAGWGPESGFPIADATTTVYIVASNAGAQSVTVNLIDVANNNAVLATATAETVAEEAVVEPSIEVTAPATVEVKTAVEADETGRIADFDPTGYESVDVTLTAGDVAYSNVRFVVAEATPGLQLIAKDTNDQWYDMVTAGWGPENGFPIADATTTVYIVASNAGTQNVTVNLVDVANDNAVLATATATTVAAAE